MLETMMCIAAVSLKSVYKIETVQTIESCIYELVANAAKVAIVRGYRCTAIIKRIFRRKVIAGEFSDTSDRKDHVFHFQVPTCCRLK